MDRKDTVKFVTVDDRCHVDQLLILPDTGGYDLTRAMFMPKHKVPPLYPPQDQQMQWFLEYQLDYFVDKKVPILGLGTSMLALWDRLGGKAMIDQGRFELMLPLPANAVVDSDDNKYTFTSERFIGLSHFNFSNKDYRIIRDFVEPPRELDYPEDTEGVFVAVE